MSLGSALDVAQNSLANVARRTQVVARNVSQAGDEAHVRREAVSIAGSGLNVRVSRTVIDRQAVALGLDARSEAGAAGARDMAVSTLASQLNGPDGNRAPAASLSRLHDAVQVWSAMPSDPSLAQSTLAAARDVAASFEQANQAIADNTTAINARIDADVAELNERLQAFADANTAVIVGARTPAGADLDAMDARDAILRDIAELVPVTTISRGDGDLVLMTRRGMTLFETVPRTVERNAAGGISIDRVPLPANSDATPPRGRLEGHLHARDNVLGSARSRLDALAADTVATFARAGAGEGLFTAGPPLAVAPDHDPAIETLRGAAAGNADALIATAERMRTGTPGTPPLLERASENVTWLDGELRASADGAATARRTAAILEEQRLQTGGVDIDAQMTRLLALERSYEASARLIAVADEMLATLLRAVR